MIKKLEIKVKSISILLLIFFPIFIIPFEIYSDVMSSNVTTASTNALVTVNTLIRPLPISFFFCTFYFAYIVIFKEINNLKKIRIILVPIFFFIINGLLYEFEIKKLVYLVLFIFPVIGYLIGYNEQIEEDAKRKFFLIFCFLLSVAQLFLAFKGHEYSHKDKIFFFTIYQNHQYFGPILILLFFYPLLTIRSTELNIKQNIFYLIYLIILSTNTIFYFSYSMYFLLICGIILLFIKFWFYINKKYLIFLTVFLFILFNLFLKNSTIINKIINQPKIKIILDHQVPQNIVHRKNIYIDYFRSFEIDNLLIGNKSLKLAEKNQSAHNYILEIIYYYGIFPAIILIFIFIKFLKKIKINNNQYYYFILLFLLYLILENLTKVSLRQPYSGIISFYLIGSLLKKMKND